MPDLSAMQSGRGPVWDLLPAAEIRRRGAARARRRRLRSAAGALTLVVLVVTPLAITGWGADPTSTVADGRADRRLSGAGQHAWPQRVPPGFALASGLAASGRSTDVHRGGLEVLRQVRICGTADWTGPEVAAPTDVLTASGPGTSGSPERRTLLVYADAHAATGLLLDVRRSAAACASRGAREIAVAVPGSAGGGAWAYVLPDGAGPAPNEDTGSLLVARVGNAVLLVQWTASATADGPPTSLPPPHVAPVLLEMCVFTSRPCSMPR